MVNCKCWNTWFFKFFKFECWWLFQNETLFKTCYGNCGRRLKKKRCIFFILSTSYKESTMVLFDNFVRFVMIVSSMEHNIYNISFIQEMLKFVLKFDVTYRKSVELDSVIHFSYFFICSVINFLCVSYKCSCLKGKGFTEIIWFRIYS